MLRFSVVFACGLWIAGCQDRELYDLNAVRVSTTGAPNSLKAEGLATQDDVAQATEVSPVKKGKPKIKKRIRATLIQYNCSDDKNKSVTRLLELVEKCAPNSDLLVLGESVFAPYTTTKDYSPVAETVPGPFTESLSKIAGQHKVHICSGLVENDGDKLFNTAVLIGPDGQILAKYHKTALFSVDKRHFQPGSGPTVVETELGRIGMLICSDSQDLELISSMASQSPNLILVPSYGLAKTDYTSKLEIDCMLDECIDEWRVRMQALAKTCHAFVLRTDHVGIEGQQVRVGHSIAVSPGGYVIAEATMRPACLDIVLKPDAPDQKHW